VDIGGTRTKFGLVDIAAGEVTDSIIKPTEKNNDAIFLEQIESVIKTFQVKSAAAGNIVAGIGIAVPGYVNEEGVVVTTYGFLKFMEAYPLKQLVQEKFLMPCLLDNDARTVALGEALYGKGKGSGRVLVLTLGTGVGFGFVVDGRFMDAAPLSHMGGNISIVSEGGECYCGKKGCLEALASSAGIVTLAKQAGFAGELSAETVFAAALAGDAAAMDVVEKLTGYLHIAIHNYANLFAPHMVVLGGGIAKGLLPYLQKIKGRSYMGPYPGYDFTLAISELKESAGMLGSAALIYAHKQKDNYETNK